MIESLPSRSAAAYLRNSSLSGMAQAKPRAVESCGLAAYQVWAMWTWPVA